MKIEEIYERVKKIYPAFTKGNFYDWQDIIKYPSNKNDLFYIKKDKDYVYIGIYSKINANGVNRTTGKLYKKPFVKSNDKYIKIYKDKVVFRKKALTFKKLRQLVNSDFALLTPLFKDIYNIHDSMNITSLRNFNCLNMKEVQGVTYQEYVKKTVKDPIVYNKVIENINFDINLIKLATLIDNRFTDEKSKELFYNSGSIDLVECQLGNFYYYPRTLEEFPTGYAKHFMNGFNGWEYSHDSILNYIINMVDKDATIHKLVYSKDKENLILAKKLFKKRYKQFWE